MLRHFVIKSYRLVKEIGAINGIKNIPFIGILSQNIIEAFVNSLAKKKKMLFPPDEYSWPFRLNYLLRWNQIETIKVAEKIIKPGMNVLDIGANFGYFTRLFSKLVGSQGKIFAFEPYPHKYQALVKNTRYSKYKNIIPIQKAIFNQEGKQVFFEMTSPNSHSLYDVSRYDLSFSVCQKLPVETTTVDSFLLQQGNPPIHFIKMDIEGAEPKALEGMKELLARSKNLVMITEFHPLTLFAAGLTPLEFIDQLTKIGFSIRAILDPQRKIRKNMTLEQLRNSQPGDGWANLLCLKEI